MVANIQDLKKELAVVSADEAKKDQALKLRKRITQMSEDADAEIKLHLRDVDFNTKEFVIEHLLQKYQEDAEDEKNELFVPDYQREFKWKEDRQSRLIESLLIGLPIPYVFLADIENEDPEYDGRIEIVDGYQRINTISSFVSNKLTLEGMTILKSLNGFKFEDLPASRQRRFLRIPIKIIELSEKCDERTRRDLFERINSGSLALQAQEQRQGSLLAATAFYKKVIEVCADNPKLHELAPVSDAKKKSGEYLELVIRFFAYKERQDQYKGDVTPFLNEYLTQFKGQDDIDPQPYIDDFQSMLSFVEENFELGFKKTEGSNSTPRARFEAISVGTALALEEDEHLTTSKEDVSEWLESAEFKKAVTSDGANNIGNFNRRIGFVKSKLLGREYEPNN